MTEIMPFPENNILFYWAAPHGGSLFCMDRKMTASKDAVISDCQKASQNFSRKRKTKSNTFSAAAHPRVVALAPSGQFTSCTWHKILIRLQVWNLFAQKGDPIKRERALWGEEMPRHRWNFLLAGNGIL